MLILVSERIAMSSVVHHEQNWLMLEPEQAVRSTDFLLGLQHQIMTIWRTGHTSNVQLFMNADTNRSSRQKLPCNNNECLDRHLMHQVAGSNAYWQDLPVLLFQIILTNSIPCEHHSMHSHTG